MKDPAVPAGDAQALRRAAAAGCSRLSLAWLEQFCGLLACTDPAVGRRALSESHDRAVGAVCEWLGQGESGR
jgi:hypothetical protein